MKKLISVIFLICLTQGSARAETITLTRTLTFTIKPVFVIKINPESGGGSYIDLGRVMAANEAPVKAVQVAVVSNTGRRYRIMQRVDRNIEGAEESLPAAEKMRYTVTDGKHGGRSLIKSWTPVSDQETEVFESNPSGEGETFMIEYKINNDQLLGAGEYHGRLEIWAVPEN